MSYSFRKDVSSSFMLEEEVTRSLCVTIDTPRALTVFLLLKHKEYSQLVNLDIDPSDYQDHSNFADDYLVTKVLSKSPNVPLDIDRRQVALNSFYESERRCAKFNSDFSPRALLPGISNVASFIKKVLGPLDTKSLDFISERFRFGPGATTGVTGSGSVLSDKYDEVIDLTVPLVPFYRSILGDRWWEHQRNPRIVEGSKFTTVPKTAKTDRGIAIEPTLNIYGQLGVGAYLRRKLRYFGIDLNTQERNQYLASVAQERNLATIDLSAASDSISWRVVQFLFPDSWFDLLDLFRSSHTSIDGKFVELEKFSSMGNGYTFELESLIFAAVVRTYVPKEYHHLTSVYGDDLIVPQQYASDVIEALEFLGFSVNTSKSFLAGRFYESCGTDWFDGQNVRPFYLRKQKGTKIPYTLQIANALRLYSNRRMNGCACDTRFRELWVWLFNSTPIAFRKCKVPVSLGDTGFIVSQREAKPRKPTGFLEGFVVSHIYAKPIKRRKTSYGLLWMQLARPVFTSDTPSYGREPVRGYLGKFRTKKTIVEQWSRGFDWV